MSLDIRIPIGLLFIIIGAILMGFGLFTASDVEMYKRSLNINMNLWSGGASLAFGAVMLGMAWWASLSEKKKPKA